jgi:hypothetical protein
MTIGKELIEDIKRKMIERKKAMAEGKVILKEDENTGVQK